MKNATEIGDRKMGREREGREQGKAQETVRRRARLPFEQYYALLKRKGWSHLTVMWNDPWTPGLNVAQTMV